MLFNVGVVLNKLGNVGEARKYYFESIKSNPFYPYSFLNLAVTYKEEKNYKKAIEILNKGLEFNEEAFLYYNRGCNYINLKNYENSLKDVKKSIELNSFFIEYSKKDKELEEIWDKI